jgi:CDP-paratose 2-epimerase
MMWCALSKNLCAIRVPAKCTISGGRANSLSILEAIARIEALTGRKINWTYSDQPRRGDHICYISNLAKLKSHYPGWNLTRSHDSTLEEIIAAEREHSQRVGT